jgi:site-specific recombinase XerD
MSEKPISPLRQRMIEDTTMRNFVEKTRNDYIRQVKTFTAFLGRSPDTATAEDLRRFQLHQTRTGVRPPSINGSVAALRFFFTVTLDRPEMARHLIFVREPRKMPAVLGACLSVALHPLCCHLQSPTDCARRERRHVQLQGLSCRRPSALQSHDARNK